MPVVVITGMRQTGKTTLLQHEPALKDRRYLTLDDFATRDAAERNPEDLISGDAPITIDEAQRVPDLLRAIKVAVDRKREPGRFLLSGSANFHLLKTVTESLAGRAVYLRLHPMHRRELLNGTAEPAFLPTLFERGSPPQRQNAAIDSLAILRGGMPAVALAQVKNRSIWFRGFEQTYLERDLRDLAQVADISAFRTLLRLAALRTGSILNQSEIGRDAKLPFATTSRYLGLLETSFLIARVPSYLSNRASRLIKAPKLYFADSGLAAHLAGARDLGPTSADPMAGALLATYVYANMTAILEATWPDAELYYWHVQGRQEVDFVILDGRATLALAVKQSRRWSDSDLKGLQSFLDMEPGCRAGVLAYQGEQTVQLGKRLWAAPIGAVLS